VVRPFLFFCLRFWLLLLLLLLLDWKSGAEMVALPLFVDNDNDDDEDDDDKSKRLAISSSRLLCCSSFGFPLLTLSLDDA
jgi:hypothetical protein